MALNADGRLDATSDEYFRGRWSHSDDPWEHGTRWYETRKYGLTVASLPHRLYRSAFEPACGAGFLTALLASRADRLLACDREPEAVAATRRRCERFRNVVVEQRRIPEDWPNGTFDLVVLSELLYYLDDDGLERAIASAWASLAPGGHLVAVHYRPEVPEHARTGDDVHAALDALLPVRPIVRHDEPEFLLAVRERHDVIDAR